MRLINCHIENFGKLSHYDMNFRDGCNIICEENGWGKSTLMTFLRVMFFGFANEGKRNELENERRRYKPWQSGAYGGSLTFEENGRKYVCFRIFGDKEKDDRFELRDANSHLEVKDFTEKLGEELFQIDQESFFKSVCISQSQSDIRFAKATGSMNAKLGNLIGEADDINNFEKADKKLSDLLNRMSPRRVTGSLNKENKEIQQYRQEVRQKSEIEKSILGLKEMQQKEIEQKEMLTTERGQINEKQKLLVYIEKKERYKELLKDYERKQEEYREARKYFPKELPTEEDLEQKIETADTMEEDRSAMEIYKLSYEEEQALELYGKQFARSMPKQEELERIKADVQRWRMNRKELEAMELPEADRNRLREYERRFAGAVFTEGELERRINDWDMRSRKKEALGTKEASLNMARMMAQKTAEAAAKEQRRQQRLLLLLLLPGLLLTCTGAGLLFLNKIIGIVFLAAGVILILEAVRRRMKLREKKSAPEDVSGEEVDVLSLEKEIRQDSLLIQKTEENMRAFLEIYGISWDEYSVMSELHQLKNDVRAYQDILARNERYNEKSRLCRNDDLQQRIETFLEIYYAPESISAGEYGELLQKLENNAEKYQQIREKKAKYQQRADRYTQHQKELERYMEGLAIEPEEDMHAQLLRFQKHLHICIERENMLKTSSQALREYEEKEDSGILKGNIENKVYESAEQLYERQKQISEQMERVQTNIHTYIRQLDDFEEELERLNEREALLEELQEAHKEKLKKYCCLEKTQEYLKAAKEKFTEKYMEPLMSGFQKYYRMLTGETAVGCRLDTDAVLTVEEQGMPRNPELLSTGYRDLLGLCMRMALADAMYQESAPFLLLDDPFVNYDDRKTEGAMQFLKKASEHYQIIYFTCRKQRKNFDSCGQSFPVPIK